ncbi:hypothetical protein QJS10_CPB19g00459 [Acorus calamus]|uniref:Uncharacterized protein n=1 Tax=Acorus calamus TaxID=4465 RepID=A0AAV9CG51_ACOCL|nr:hypothetical protein QJS10_CPB19g00459 [Acorus calamus]
MKKWDGIEIQVKKLPRPICSMLYVLDIFKWIKSQITPDYIEIKKFILKSFIQALPKYSTI